MLELLIEKLTSGEFMLISHEIDGFHENSIIIEYHDGKNIKSTSEIRCLEEGDMTRLLKAIHIAIDRWDWDYETFKNKN